MSEGDLLKPNPRSDAQLRALVFVWIWTKQLRLPRDVARLIGEIVRKDVILRGDARVVYQDDVFIYNGRNWYCESIERMRYACNECKMPYTYRRDLCLKHNIDRHMCDSDFKTIYYCSPKHDPLKGLNV